jgi:DNA-binding response OmpR family regulator
MCIEGRHKQQDFLREYFSKHGFRVLVLSDIARGLARLKNSPPDCMVIMGETLGERAVKGYDDACALLQESQAGIVLVLGEKQSALKEQLAETESARVLVQPVTLRDLRKVVKRTIGISSNGEEPDPSENGSSGNGQA